MTQYQKYFYVDKDVMLKFVNSSIRCLNSESTYVISCRNLGNLLNFSVAYITYLRK